MSRTSKDHPDYQQWFGVAILAALIVVMILAALPSYTSLRFGKGSASA